MSQSKFAIIVAGGIGSRMKSTVPKQFIDLDGKPILMYTLEKFYTTVEDIKIILTLPEEEIKTWENLCEKHNFQIPHQVRKGGETRFHSVKNGLNAIEKKIGLVAVHDGVRPFVNPDVILTSYQVAETNGAAITAVALKDSIRKVDGNNSFAQDRSIFRLVQTPQTFQVELLKKAYEQEFVNTFTDDASVVEAMGQKVELIDGNYENIKITTPEDLLVAKAFLK
ncbi:2-C-methyl-D-erythritol 4-phosphate cytidylyltransferase [Sediminitomix flava]|uniref:2-C-methyl-D-erythritol 4-phosphate cytidylyltransferase n=1 Tax=Sediminitomix flava TaxID=379075 RepID=A0A315Z5T4_SEDFL|nr:2-C-methyl-D-erythritol 4-phosphate cytidylyltransferase [Sediminitomix flava]PWJ39268.1 2-C-methyl-D-erythritol 4-phosphate cytidylyltransferase [Sediminitomix flava]